MSITFDNSGSSTNLVNFPVLISLTPSTIDYSKTKSGGADLRFVDADGVTVLSHEIESWNPGGTSRIWVRVPQLDRTNTDYIWMYSNNAAATDGQGKSAVWDSNFRGVWHFGDGTVLSGADSTSNAITCNLQNAPTATTGIIGGGLSLNGQSQYCSFASVIGVSSLTVSAWIFRTDNGSRQIAIFGDPNGEGLIFDNNGWMNYLCLVAIGGDGASGANIGNSLGAWHYVTLTYDSATSTSTIYADGNVKGTVVHALDMTGPNGFSAIGTGRIGSRFFLGTIDEARIASVARSLDWSRADYKTESGTMNTFGPAESLSAPPPTVSLSASPSSITAGSSATLTWSSTNATSCSASGAWSGTRSTSGTQSVSPGSTATYTLTCTGSGTATQSATVTVTSPAPPPTVSLSASPSSITAGSSATLTWSSTNATSCSASGAWSGTPSTAGTQSVSPSSTATYILTCTGNGTATQSVVVTVTSSTPIPNPTGPWWNTSWLNRVSITFDNSGSSANLVNFPVLISLTPSTIDYSKTKSGGADLRFVDADGVTVLSHEIESWNPGGVSRIWVRVPQLDRTNTDYIWMYSNNAAATDGQAKSAVWDSSFGGVWHFGNGTVLSGADSTSNAITCNLQNAPTATTGIIGGGLSLNGQNQYCSFASVIGVSSLTVSAWIFRADDGSRQIGVFSDASGGLVFDNNGWMNYLCLVATGGDGAAGANIGNSLGAWHYVTLTYESATSTSTIYADGNVKGTVVHALDVTGTNGFNAIGTGRIGTRFFLGTIDEARIASVARSPDWSRADYKTESGTMNTFGFAESRVIAP